MAPRGTKGERGKPAIEDLGFRPNGNAASLRNRRSRLVGLVQPSITNSFFAQMASEFGKLAIAAGYRAARALSGLGHRAIAVLVPDMVIHPNQHRTRGVERALREADAADGCRVVVGGQTIDGGRSAIEQELRREDRVTATVAATNIAKLGAIKAIQSLQLAKPRDISLIGFDDFDWMTALRPYVSAVAQPTDRLAAKAWNLLQARMDGQAGATAQHVIFDGELKIREASGRPS